MAGVTALLSVGALFVAPGAGHAAPASPSSSPRGAAGYDWTQTATPPTEAQRRRGINEIISRMPGARQIDARTVELQPGLRMRFRQTADERAAEGAGVAAAYYVCNTGNTCAYSNQLANLALNTVEGGSGSPNDMIDGVHTCGSVPSPWTPNYP